MAESEKDHVKRVMQRFKVDTILISRPEGGERVYIDGQLVHDGPTMSADKYQYESHIVCNTNGGGEWECSSYSGEPQEETKVDEASI
jgi:hypothetical protein